MEKNCAICNKTIIKASNESKKAFVERHKFCSKLCKYVWNSQLNKERGWKPPTWPKGKKKPLKTLEHRKKLSKYRKGKTYEELYGIEKAQEMKEKLKTLKGANNPNWKGGPKTNKALRLSPPHLEWHNLILKRDDYTYQICRIRGGHNLRTNHIKRFVDYPELRLELTNGITICKKCDLKWVLHREPEWESYFNFNLKNRGFLPDEHLPIQLLGGKNY